MSSPLKTGVTVIEQDFNWLYAKPVEKSPSVSINNDTRLYLPRPDPADCKCDTHGLVNKKIRYKQLADKERRLRDELIKINREMTNLTSSMLDNACDADETKSVYKTDYERRDMPITQYRLLMAATDSSIGSPITPAIIDLKDIYKDPIRFRYSAMERPTIQPAKTISQLKVPETCSFWDKPFTGSSEYMDNISKLGLSNMKNQQQYLHPLVCSKRKLDDCNK